MKRLHGGMFTAGGGVTEPMPQPRLDHAVIRIKTEQPVPDGWRIVRILATWTVSNNDGGTGWHYEYDVEMERV